MFLLSSRTSKDRSDLFAIQDGLIGFEGLDERAMEVLLEDLETVYVLLRKK